MSIFKRTSNWHEIPGVEISISGRGEGIVYREGGREYHFNIYLGRTPLTLYANKYWNGILPPTESRLTDEEHARIIPRLVAYLGCKGDPVEVCEHETPAALPALSGRDVWEYRRKHGIK